MEIATVEQAALGLVRDAKAYEAGKKAFYVSTKRALKSDGLAELPRLESLAEVLRRSSSAFRAGWRDASESGAGGVL